MARKKLLIKEKSETLAQKILSEIAHGGNLHQISRDCDMPLTTLWDWITKDYSEQYARARELGAEFILDEILMIADDAKSDYYETSDGKRKFGKEHVARARVRIQARLDYLSKIAPKKYGDEVERRLKITGEDRSIPTASEVFGAIFGKNEQADNS